MKKFFKFYLPGAILLVLLIFFFQPNPYFRNALIYLTAGITDYEIFENREVAIGNPQPWKISDHYNSYNLTEQDLDLLKSYETVAFLVIKDTSILFESYWDGYSENSMSSSFSMAKSITSLLVGAAIKDGLISSVNDPIDKYLPEYKDHEYTITIKDLLTMGSGLKWNENYFNPFSETTKSYYGRNVDKLVLKPKSEGPPKEKFHYIVTNPQLLSIIVKRVTGKTLSEYTSEKLWQPIGAENMAYWSLDQKDGDEKATCCFNSNARDFARIGQLVLNNGNWNGQQIVEESYLQESLKPASYLKDENDKPVDFYGYQWWICNYHDTMIYYARGILGQYILCIPEKNMVIIRLGHKRSKNRINHHPAEIFEYIDLAYKIAESK